MQFRKFSLGYLNEIVKKQRVFGKMFIVRINEAFLLHSP
jgi:hypothetical protein